MGFENECMTWKLSICHVTFFNPLIINGVDCLLDFILKGTDHELKKTYSNKRQVQIKEIEQ